jgi:transposase InsO family protein
MVGRGPSGLLGRQQRGGPSFRDSRSLLSDQIRICAARIFSKFSTPPGSNSSGIAISMDGRGRFMDNILIERLWRSIKYEEMYLKAYAEGREARAGIGLWITFLKFLTPSSGNKQPDGRMAPAYIPAVEQKQKKKTAKVSERKKKGRQTTRQFQRSVVPRMGPLQVTKYRFPILGCDIGDAHVSYSEKLRGSIK